PKFVQTCQARFDPQVEAAMAQAYGGLDVRDPRVSLRRFAVLLDYLPPSARRIGQQWSTEAELLALLVDHVAYLTWVTLRAAGAKNAPKPSPIPRPATATVRPSPQPVGPPAGESAGSGTGPSWERAAQQLALIPGVVVEHG